MTLTFELDTDTVKVNQYVKYLGQGSFSSNAVVRKHGQTLAHRTDRSTRTIDGEFEFYEF